MAIFARRRLQTMLDELSSYMDEEQAHGLIRRIESKQIEQALPAEMELGLAWCMLQLGPLEIEPEWYNEKRLPDLFSEHLFPGSEAIVEITALSDAVLPADEGMRNASRKLAQEAGRLRRGASRHLSFYFSEETVRIEWETIRRVCAPRDLEINDRIGDLLRRWLVGQERHEGDKLHVHEGLLDVLVTWHDKPQSQYNFWTSMPPEIRSLTNNYVYRALENKARQIRNPHFDGIKCVILADVGSTALRKFDEVDRSYRVFNGGQIVSQFLKSRSDPGIDVVAIITPNRRRMGLFSQQETIEWKIGLICRPGFQVEQDGFQRIAALLPKPRREGYQSRQLHEQAVFAPTARGRYLSTTISWRQGEKTEIRFSSRALLDLLAGRITLEQARGMFEIKGSNILKTYLDRGETISGVRFETAGPDSDDDHLVIELSDDPAARLLRGSTPEASIPNTD